ncbi:MAG: hypothetical protein U1E26_03430 [Coriobacteriia bacterium]|nr:hypothetical protein [Coriobacteriia bacterium]
MRLDEHVSALLLPVALRVAGKPFDRMVAELQTVEALTADEVAQLQWQRLTTLIAHSYEHVPYYRASFDALGIHPSDIRSRADYANLPTVGRSTIVEHGRELIADDQDPTDLKVVYTGGSTGVAAQVHQSSSYSNLGWSTFQRNLDWTGFVRGERQAWFTRPAIPTLERRVRLALERKWVVGITVRSPKALEQWTNGMLRRQPRFVYGYATSIAALAGHALDRGVRFDSVRRVMTTSETLTDEMRATIQEAFGAPVFNQYGSTEILAIASECEHGSMHINSDINYVEFVPVTKPGGIETHEIIATPLMQSAQPLLRFRTGDQGDPVSGSCPCGRPFPLMGQVTGHIDDVLVFSGGAEVSGILLERLVRPTYGIARFQIQQTSRDSLTLLIVPNQRYGERTQAELADLQDRFAQLTGASVVLTPVLVDAIPLLSSGKLPGVVRLDEEAPPQGRS